MAFGIVCEYNPFHNGHLHQIEEIKRMSDEPIVCVMSGNFTQRGEIAVMDKYSRAKMALLAGADAVFELPVPFCMASAEYFASASVRTLALIGVDKLCFGSESSDAESIMRIAKIACSDSFKAECESLPKEQGSASAYFELLARKAGAQTPLSNDILAIEYAKAIIKNGYNMSIFPIKREGSAYRDTELTAGAFPSASAIRESMKNGSLDKVARFVPSTTLEIMKDGELASFESMGDSILLALRLSDPERLCVAVSDAGLINRIVSIANESTSFAELEERLQTKKYTRAAIRRAMLYILLGIEQRDLDSMPADALLLAANEKGREYISSVRKSSRINIITKPADMTLERQAHLLKKADALYSMCFENKKESGFYIKRSPVIK